VTTDPAKAKPMTASAAKTSPGKTSPGETNTGDTSTGKTPARDGAPPQTAPTTAGDAASGVIRWILLLVAAGLGVIVGAIGSFAHRATATAFGVAWPTGLFFSFCGLVGLMLALGELLPNAASRSWRPSRLSGVACAAAGWLLALLWVTYLGPPPSAARKGDVILANDWRSLAYLFGGMLLATVAVYRAWVANLAEKLAAHSKG
jgi:hypothetical protein